MKLRPLNDYIIVKRVPEKDRTNGGIYIPEAFMEKPVEGEVLAVGNGRTLENGRLHPLGVRAGEVVLFTRYAGTDIKLDGEDLLMLRESDVVGVLEAAPEAAQ